MSETLTKALDVEIKADDDSRQFTAAISTNAVDRDGEVLIPQGMNSKEFEKNPVVFYNHDYDKPIAKQVSKFQRGDAQIVATAEFAERPKDFDGPWFPDEIRGLVTAGVVKGVSVGFQEVEGGTRNATKADVEHFGPDVKRVFNAWKLLEWSVAPLQSNPDALIQASHKGLISPSRCEELFGVTVPERKTQVAVLVPERRKSYTFMLRMPPKARPPKRPRKALEGLRKAARAGIKKQAGGLYG